MLVSPRASGVCCCPCLRLTHTIIYISFGFPRMDVFYLGRSRPRHVHRPSAAHSRSGGEVHVCRKVWQTRKVTIRTRYWLYSQPSFAAPTINWSWRGSYSAGYALLHSRVHTQSGALRLATDSGNISGHTTRYARGIFHRSNHKLELARQLLRWLRASAFAGTYSKWCFTVSDGLWQHFWTYNSLCSWHISSQQP